MGDKSAHGLIVCFYNYKPWADIMSTAFLLDTDMNIVLIGYRCSGKTSVGKIIAEKTKRIFMDTDLMIQEKTGSSSEAR